MLACVFHRAGRSHAVVISVDHLDCGAAGDVLLLDADHLPEALDMMRAVHDSDGPDEDTADLPVDEDGPGYPALAALVRARMTVLPVPGRPAASHADEDAGRAGLVALQALAQLAGSVGGAFGAGGPVALRGRAVAALPATLPAKRKKSGRPAPVYQLKVGLRGAKPPIWRRLEVPADVSLARLHMVIQAAFGWDDSHLHVFETPYGRFGIADADLGHRAEAPVTLEQVAPAAGGKLRYVYDFGDDWEHDIVVEKVLDRDPAAAYPRCTTATDLMRTRPTCRSMRTARATRPWRHWCGRG